jgi:hypothetical protein
MVCWGGGDDSDCGKRDQVRVKMSIVIYKVSGLQCGWFC